MSKFERLVISITTAAMIAVSGIGVFSVSAAYDNCDVNRDGDVNMTDLSLLTKYLYGGYSVPNYNQLDVNRSLTVDAADLECLTARLTGGTYQACYYSRANEMDNDSATSPDIPFPNVSGFTSDAYASSTAGREYRRYSYKQKKELDPYTLTPTIGNLNSGGNSRAIVDGLDTRYRATNLEENLGIVCLQINNVAATGFIVGDHQIATAAHCVYDGNNWYSIGIKTYNLNGEVSNKSLTPVEAHIPSSFTNVLVSTYDYALITVKEDLSGYVHFSLGNSYNVTASNYANVPIYVTGCPQPVYEDTTNEISNNSYKLYSEQGNVIDTIYHNTQVLYYNTDASGGDSGAPVYTITKNIVNGEDYYTYTALAVHHGGTEGVRNSGSLITKYHLQFYNNNPNVNYNVN